jgi:hypothetical protein
MPPPSEFEINGEWPELEGQALDALLCQEYHYAGKLTEPANVIFFKVGPRLSSDELRQTAARHLILKSANPREVPVVDHHYHDPTEIIGLSPGSTVVKNIRATWLTQR